MREWLEEHVYSCWDKDPEGAYCLQHACWCACHDWYWRELDQIIRGPSEHWKSVRDVEVKGDLL